MAEGIFKKLLKERKLASKVYCDSAGTSDYHIGELADPRMRSTARKYNIELTHKARQIAGPDFEEFDYIIVMDESNNANIISHLEWKESFADKLLYMRQYDEIAGDRNIPDPYFGGQQGFEDVYQMLLKANTRFLNFLIEKHQL
jgi:protein-tyrosine phosphatase